MKEFGQLRKVRRCKFRKGVSYILTLNDFSCYSRLQLKRVSGNLWTLDEAIGRPPTREQSIQSQCQNLDGSINPISRQYDGPAPAFLADPSGRSGRLLREC